MLGLWLNITTHKMILLPYLPFFFYDHNVISLLLIVFFSTPLSPSCEEGVLNPLPSPRPFQKGKGCNRCAIRLAGHQSPRQVVMRDGTALLKAGHQSPRQVVRDGTALLKTGHQRSRHVVREGTA